MAERAHEICSIHKIIKDMQLDCSRCGGSGDIECDDPGMRRGVVKCWGCGGSGLAPWLECEVCLDEDDYES